MSDLLNAKSTPTRDTVITFLLACGLDGEAQRPWLTAWERVATAHQPRPASAVRVREARPRLLGVHAAIQIPGAAGELPPYVPRDLDADLRTALTAAAAQGGFVLLIGGSSVGKTRAVYEAVHATLPEWWLLHPDPGATPAIAAHAEAPTPRMVLWLDELQRYLNHPTGLPAGTLRRLITAGTVVVATLWPDEYNIRISRPRAGEPDPYANDRDLLGLAWSIEVPEMFSRAERRRGETLAGTDQRIRVALDTADAGFTQFLAAGPALIRRWTGGNCYDKAVMTAALDARRVGACQPVTSDFLEAAAPAYLTPAQQATAPPDWLDRALSYATTLVHGAAACLAPVPAGMGLIAGYVPADYLHQHALGTRRTTVLPDLVWTTLTTHHHPDDRLALAQNAERRGQPAHAIALYQRAADVSGSWFVNARLADALAGQGRVEEALQGLREHAATGDGNAAIRLADMLAKHGRINELHDRAGSGDGYAASWLADVLAKQGSVDKALQMLRDRAATGDGNAAIRLADVLARHGRIDELHDRAGSGDGYAAIRLADVLAKQGSVDKALQVLRDRAVAGDGDAAHWLADMLAGQGRIDEAIQILRDRAATGDGYAAVLLTDMLAGQGRIDEAIQILRDRAATGGTYAAFRLADVPVDVLAEQGRIDELRDRAAAGDGYAARRLADMLAGQGRIDEAIQILRDRAATGDGYAAVLLTDMLARQGRIDELRDEVAAGTFYAVESLRRLDQAG
ncbi:tetratricopeptide repeat protein [Dactylosporangium sucinum]|uniref:tetratricopeptide repeat protein n=1 Tax=Dactylosporangium sucinum TaxID=1424081 RepID=UPI00167C47F0|nr:tetratricopeptide repeat protein [Dactylosporangium sucinum]